MEEQLSSSDAQQQLPVIAKVKSPKPMVMLRSGSHHDEKVDLPEPSDSQNVVPHVEEVDLPEPSDAQEVVPVVEEADLPELGYSEVLESYPAQLTVFAKAVDQPEPDSNSLDRTLVPESE